MDKHYETVFILTPVLSEQQTKDAVQKFRDFLKAEGAEIYHSEHWGMKRMAYPINHKQSGVYQLFEFKADPTVVAKLELTYRRDESVIRFLTVSLNKYAVDYNARRRENMNKPTESKS